MIDHESINLFLTGLQFQAELLLKRGKDVGRCGRVRRRRQRIVRRPAQFVVVFGGEACLVDDDSL